MKKEIIAIIKELKGSEPLYFKTAVTIKTTPHTPACYLWAVDSKFNGWDLDDSPTLYVMDSNEQWHEVDDKDEIVIQSIYQRVKLIQTITHEHSNQLH